MNMYEFDKLWQKKVIFVLIKIWKIPIGSIFEMKSFPSVRSTYVPNELQNEHSMLVHAAGVWKRRSEYYGITQERKNISSLLQKNVTEKCFLYARSQIYSSKYNIYYLK